MEELDLREIFYMFWNKKLTIIIITILFIIAGGAYSFHFVTPTYKASANLVLVQTSSMLTPASETAITTTDLTLNSKLVSTYSELIKTDTILSDVVTNLNISKAELKDIKKNISVKSVEDTEIIEIIVNDKDPEFAAKVANEIAAVFSKKIVEIYNISNVYLLDEAQVPTTPNNVNHIKDMAIFAIGGIVVAAAYILVLNMFDNTVKTEEDIENATGLKNLAYIPDFQKEIKSNKGGNR